MNACPVLLLFVLSTCQGKQQDSSHASGILATKKSQKLLETILEDSCPEPTEIEPCECFLEGRNAKVFIDCSRVQDEEQLRKVFSASFPKTNMFQFLMLENKGVKVLEDGVFGNISFSSVYFEDCALETISNDALTPSLNTLNAIWVWTSQIATFPFEKLPEFTALGILHLSGIKIQSIPPLSSSTLESISLADNAIPHISTDIFKFLPNLTDLDLSYNHLTEITPETFNVLPKLQSLYLIGNELSHLQTSAFGKVPTKSLHLSQNKIESVEVGAFKDMAATVDSIWIRDNALTTLDEEVWRPVLEKGTLVLLKGNPLACGCDVAWLIREPKLLAKTDAPPCADGTPMEDLDPADFDHCK